MNLQNKISSWLEKYLVENNLSSFVIGVSGGIDSAVTSALCAKTDKKTIVLTMPIHQNPEETDRGKKIIECQETIGETSTMSQDEFKFFRFFHFLIQMMWGKKWYYYFLIFRSSLLPVISRKYYSNFLCFFQKVTAFLSIFLG